MPTADRAARSPAVHRITGYYCTSTTQEHSLLTWARPERRGGGRDVVEEDGEAAHVSEHSARRVLRVRGGQLFSAAVCESTLPRRRLCPVGLCATGQTCPELARSDELEELDSAVQRRQATLAQASGTLLRRVAPCEALGPSRSGAVVLWDAPPQSR